MRQKLDKWEPQTGDTFRKKGTTSPTYHLCGKREDGITFGFVENREVGISGGEITMFALRNDYELVERPKSIEDVVKEELNRDLQTKVGQKRAWSEEDETNLRRTEYAVMKFFGGDCSLVGWLRKSLKDRVGCEANCITTKEWSVEDMSKIQRICKYLDEAKKYYADITEVRECIDWLKSLKDRYTWKPSDEQMTILYKYAEQNNYDGSILTSLYNELKKLREE